MGFDLFDCIISVDQRSNETQKYKLERYNLMTTNSDDQISSSVGIDDAVAQFKTYEDYLDSQITATDLFYLEVHHILYSLPEHFKDEEIARQLVELGYRGSGETLKREEFNSRKKALAEAMLAKEQQKK